MNCSGLLHLRKVLPVDSDAKPAVGYRSCPFQLQIFFGWAEHGTLVLLGLFGLA
jgi:hypothetical protein